MNIEKHLEILGMEVEDRITGFKGIVTSVSFDLIGGIEVLITPKVKDDGKNPDRVWVYMDRVKVTDTNSEFEIPTFN